MKIRVLGNYKPSGHSCGRIIDKSGIAPTVMENHGEVTCITVDDEGLTFGEKVKLVKEFINLRNSIYGKEKIKDKETYSA